MLRRVTIFTSLIAVFLVAGCIPQVKISSPKEGTTIILGDSITFQGIARDGDSVLLTETDSLDWYVDDRFVHTGPSYTTDTLALGVHTIGISRYVDAGMAPSILRDTVTITVLYYQP